MQKLITLLSILYIRRERGDDVHALIKKAELLLDKIISERLEQYESD